MTRIMPFAPSTAPVPHGFTTASFRVLPIGPQFNVADYEAVMSSVGLLRAWSDSPWPEDEFSLESNEEDLEMHADEHARRLAFGYSVQDPTGLVLGSIYINPLAETFNDYPVDEATRARLAPFVGRVEFWLRADALELRPELFDALQRWLDERWPWPVVFGARRDMDEVRALYESCGLTKLAHLVSETGRVQTLYGRAA